MHLIECITEIFVHPGDFLHIYILYYTVVYTPYVIVNMCREVKHYIRVKVSLMGVQA